MDTTELGCHRPVPRDTTGSCHGSRSWRNSWEDGQMRAIMTVTGLDHTGIIAAIATGLAERDANITNVSQTLMGEYFTMILQVDFEEGDITLPELQAAMAEIGRTVGMEVRMQSEAIFNAMHRL